MEEKKRFIVMLAREDGGIEFHPMKRWLRLHPERVPEGTHHTDSTSHQLRDALKRHGWTVHTTAEEVRLIPPGNSAGEIAAEVLGDEDEEYTESSATEIEEAAFQQENQLRDFIAHNLATIDFQGRRLRLYRDVQGSGVEYPTAVGPIDILAVDSAETLVVFELKRARTSDHVIGQLTRYMGALRERFGSNRAIHGVIVAREISRNLHYQVKVIPNISLLEYEIQFKLKPAIHANGKTDEWCS